MLLLLGAFLWSSVIANFCAFISSGDHLVVCNGM